MLHFADNTCVLKDLIYILMREMWMLESHICIFIDLHKRLFFFFFFNWISYQISVPTILNSQALVAVKTRFRFSYFLTQPRLTVKCDMIKGNESDVGNIDFELQA